jgi:hypothetical protein
MEITPGADAKRNDRIARRYSPLSFYTKGIVLARVSPSGQAGENE